MSDEPNTDDEDDRTGVPPEGGYVAEFPAKSDDKVYVVHDATRVFVAPVDAPPPTHGDPLPEGWVDIGTTVDSFTLAPHADVRIAEKLRNVTDGVRVDAAEVDGDGNLRIDAAVVGAAAEHFHDAALHGVSIATDDDAPLRPQLPASIEMPIQLPEWEGARRRLINTLVGKMPKERTYTVPNRAERRRAARGKGRR